MTEITTDLLVIGSGPAGQKAAMQAAKLGKKVIIVEKDRDLGGASLNSGTIPSKSLREAILDLTDFYGRSFYGQNLPRKEISINDLNFRLQKTLEQQREILHKQLEKNSIKVIHGQATFVDENRVTIYGEDKEHLANITPSYVIIAAGSKPRNPEGIPFDRRRVLDSTRLLSIDYLPKSLLVLGGGVIGSEYASFFSALGTKVKVIDKKEQMLSTLDQEISMHLQKALTSIGLEFVGNKVIDQVIRRDSNVLVKFKDGTEEIAETLLYALGRSANVEELKIENAGIKLSESGYIPVNALFQTSNPNIYAVGDVIGGASLAPISMEQGRLAARHAFGGKTHHFPTFFPIGIYTIPEISSCGYTEEQLKKLGYKYEIGRAYYYEIARNQIVGNDPGMFKILFHSDTLEILGIHIIGRAATEVIHIGQVAMTFNAKLDYFVDQIFNYPTYAEGYRIAALNGMNKVKHKR